MKLTTPKPAMNYGSIPPMKQFNFCLIMLLIIFPFLSHAQEKVVELPESFFGDWVEDQGQCEIFPILSIVDSEEGLLVSSLEGYSSEVKVENKGDVYTLFIKGSSEEGGFETQINLQMGEDGELVYSFPDAEAINLVKWNLDGELSPLEGEFVVGEMEDLMVVDTLVAAEEFDFLEAEDSVTISLELLQGKWQSLEDEASIMVIEGDRMKNYYGGMDEELDNEAMRLEVTCMNEADSTNGLPAEKNRYLSNPNLDRCWYIEFVDDTNLSLIYMATGNTLTYRRVE